MNAFDYLEEKTFMSSELKGIDTLVVKEDDAYEAVDITKREIAQSIRDKYASMRGKSVNDKLSEIIRYCEGIIDF